jgi:hypothetical protein
MKFGSSHFWLFNLFSNIWVWMWFSTRLRSYFGTAIVSISFLYLLKIAFLGLNGRLISMISSGLGVHPFEGKDPRTTLGYVRHDAGVGLTQRRSGSGDGSGDALGYVGVGAQQRGSGSGNGSGDAAEYFRHIAGVGLTQCGSGSGDGSGDTIEYFSGL